MIRPPNEAARPPTLILSSINYFGHHYSVQFPTPRFMAVSGNLKGVKINTRRIISPFRVVNCNLEFQLRLSPHKHFDYLKSLLCSTSVQLKNLGRFTEYTLKVSTLFSKTILLSQNSALSIVAILRTVTSSFRYIRLLQSVGNVSSRDRGRDVGS